MRSFFFIYIFVADFIPSRYYFDLLLQRPLTHNFCFYLSFTFSFSAIQILEKNKTSASYQKMAADIRTSLDSMVASVPLTEGYVQVPGTPEEQVASVFQCKGRTIQFGMDMSVNRIVSGLTKGEKEEEEEKEEMKTTPIQLGLYTYQTLSPADFEAFDKDYGMAYWCVCVFVCCCCCCSLLSPCCFFSSSLPLLFLFSSSSHFFSSSFFSSSSSLCSTPTTEDAGCHNFNKPNMTSANVRHTETTPSLLQLWINTETNGDTCEFHLQGDMPKLLFNKYGAPQIIWTSISLTGTEFFFFILILLISFLCQSSTFDTYSYPPVHTYVFFAPYR